MAYIRLDHVSVEFPVYNINALSFKKNFIRMATGGRVLEDANQHVIVRSINQLSLEIQHGDRVGLIGHNGAGKSTFLRLLAGIYEPSSGDIDIQGKVSTMLDLMYGIESECTGYENIYNRGLLLGMTKSQVKANIEEIAEFSSLGDYLNMPVRTYSAGMMVRLAFAISASVQPDILLIDEVFGAGDANFMEKAQAKMRSLLNSSRIVVFASHAPKLIQEFCNKILVLNAGELQFFGGIDDAKVHFPELF
jgi:ABC-type polysaccharide/polyol phosphate transport system ATPase subunit